MASLKIRQRVVFAIAAALVSVISATSSAALQQAPFGNAPWVENGRPFEAWRWGDVQAAPLGDAERALLDQSRAALDRARAAREASQIGAAQDGAREALRTLMESAALTGRVERALLVRSLVREVVERWPHEARAALIECVATLRRERPEGDIELLRAQEMLALAEIISGSASAGLEKLERVVLVAEHALPSNDDELARLRAVLATELAAAQTDDARAQSLLRAALDEAETAAAVDGLALVRLMRRSGKIEEATERAQLCLEALRRVRGRDSLDEARAREELARCVSSAGDRARALELYETALETWRSISPASEREIRNLRLDVVRELENLERYEDARGVLEDVLAQLERAVPADDLSIILVKARLATALLHTHDLERADALANAAWSRCEELGLSFEESARRSAAQALDRVLVIHGRSNEAIALLVRQLEHYEATNSASDETLAWMRLRLAVRYKEVDRLAEALALEEQVLAVFATSLGPEHIETLSARNNRARTLMRMGRLQEAGAEWSALREMLVEREASALLRSVRVNLVQLADKRRDARALRESTLELLNAALEACVSHPALSRREAAEWAWAVGFEIGLAATLADSKARDAAVAERVFELVETCKSLQRSGYRSPAPFDADPEAASLSEQVRLSRHELSSAASSNADSNTIERLSRERDRAERLYAERSLALGASRMVIEAPAVREALRPDAAAVGYAVVDLFDKNDMTAAATPTLVAHVVRSEGPPIRISLGEVAQRRREVEALRAAAGVPLDAEATGSANDDERERAESIVRAQLVDPVLAACGDAKELIIALDGPVSLVPIDALAGLGGLLGEARRIRFVPSFAELVAPGERSPETKSALVIGGVDYGPVSVDEAPVEASAQVAGVAPRRPDTAAFEPLGASAREARDAGAAMQRALQSPIEHLAGEHATRASVLTAIERARFMHAATHAWSAPTSQASASFAPLSLVGLAFAGVNDAVRRGSPHEAVVFAEELAGLDLRGLELAVLSACGTHAGVLEDGQGVQSLQAALHAAGARWTVASLWPVDDAATRELMAAFYRELLERPEPFDPAAALWAARMERRDAGEAYRNWAGWVATGVAR